MLIARTVRCERSTRASIRTSLFSGCPSSRESSPPTISVCGSLSVAGLRSSWASEIRDRNDAAMAEAPIMPLRTARRVPGCHVKSRQTHSSVQSLCCTVARRSASLHPASGQDLTLPSLLAYAPPVRLVSLVAPRRWWLILCTATSGIWMIGADRRLSKGSPHVRPDGVPRA